ncbi:unnamed protein product [Rodentolepis nana]|uniref:DUF4704 domain-containing protein n=1 Tax=Rodentolepis nana TaxID=102285 RepID=A0A0R3TSA7_RODNA|nr:unnamed protein product [Rodentolepis nana]
MAYKFESSSNTNSWSGGSTAWNAVSQLLEETFVQDFDSTSPEANLRAIRNIRNFITANPINKQMVVQNDHIRRRIMSLTGAFATPSEYTTTFKRDFLCMYASFLRESPTFAEEMCNQRDFIIDLLAAVDLSSENTDPPLREAILLFLKTLFEADNLDQDLESVPAFKRAAALEIFTVERLGNLIRLCEALFDSVRRGSKEGSTALVCLTKLFALLVTDSKLAERNVEPLLRFAHRGVMATICPRHAPLVNQDRGLILPFDVAKVAQCPESTACTPYSRCHLAQYRSGSRTLDGLFRSRNRKEVRSDHLYYYPRDCAESVEPQNSADGSHRGDGQINDSCGESSSEDEFIGMDALGVCSPDGAFGLSGTADRNMCLLVGLLRGVLFWRCCSTFKGETKKEEDGGNPVAGPSRAIVARDRFGNEIARSDGLDLSDDQISLLVLQPLTQHSLPLNGTRVNTWACHIVVLVLKQRQSLHRHLLYSQLLTSEFDDTVSCLLKALQSTCDYASFFFFIDSIVNAHLEFVEELDDPGDKCCRRLISS